MLKRTRLYLAFILLLLVISTIGACFKNLNVSRYHYRERVIKLGQTAPLYRRHSLRITQVEVTTDPTKILNKQEQRLLSDTKNSQFIVVKATSSYRSSDHIVLNVDQNNSYQSSPFGTRRYTAGYKYVFRLQQRLSGSVSDHDLRLSVDNPDLPNRTRNVFSLTP